MPMIIASQAHLNESSPAKSSHLGPIHAFVGAKVRKVCMSPEDRHVNGDQDHFTNLKLEPVSAPIRSRYSHASPRCKQLSILDHLPYSSSHTFRNSPIHSKDDSYGIF